MLVCLMGFMHAIVRTGGLFNVVPLVAAQNLGLGAGQIGGGMALGSLFGLLATYPSGMIADRFGRKPLIVAAALLTGVSFFGYWFATTGLQFGAACIVWGIAAAVTGNLGGRGIFGVELFVKGDMVWFSEVSPRPHDTGLVTLRSQVLSEFEMHARAVLGLPVVTTMASPGASAVIYGGTGIGPDAGEGGTAQGGMVEGVGFEGVARALAVPESELRLFGKPSASEFRRMGVAVATAEDVELARERAREAASRVTVVR